MKPTKAMFKKSTPLAMEIGDLLAGKNVQHIATALGMIMSVNSEAPEDLEDMLDLVRFSAYAYKCQCIKKAKAAR